MSEKVLNPQTLNLSAKVYLEETLAKDLMDLTVYDIGFLRARRAYLTAEQKEFFADAFNGKFKGIDYKEEIVEAPRKTVTVKVDENGRKIIDSKDFDLKTLIQMCKDAGLKFDDHSSKQELADLLNNR